MPWIILVTDTIELGAEIKAIRDRPSWLKDKPRLCDSAADAMKFDDKESAQAYATHQNKFRNKLLTPFQL